MRSKIASLFLMCSSAACSAPDKLEMPTIPDPPSGWQSFSWSSIPGSACPKLEGEYSEPPLIFRTGNEARYTASDNFDLYSSYIPFHLAERRELEANELDLPNDSFVIRQPDKSQFQFVYLNEHTQSIVEYLFLSSEGDFKCHGGYIEFPNYTTYGIIEGKSVNFQIRNIVVKDEAGALVIQSTRGPFRGNTIKSKSEFTYEFIRYPIANEARDSK